MTLNVSMGRFHLHAKSILQQSRVSIKFKSDCLILFNTTQEDLSYVCVCRKTSVNVIKCSNVMHGCCKLTMNATIIIRIFIHSLNALYPCIADGVFHLATVNKIEYV